jgi:hypothetical protein
MTCVSIGGFSAVHRDKHWQASENAMPLSKALRHIDGASFPQEHQQQEPEVFFRVADERELARRQLELAELAFGPQLITS